MTPRRLLVYVVFFSAMFIFFAVLRFPQQAAARHISILAGNLFPDMTVYMDRAIPAFPPGLVCENAVMQFGGQLEVKPDDLRLAIVFSSLFKPEKEMDFSAGLMGGQMTGRISGVSLARKEVAGLDMSLTGIKVNNILYVTPNLTSSVSLTLQGRYVFPDAQDATAARGNLSLFEVVCEIENELFAQMDMDSLDFEQIDIEFFRHGNRISIVDFNARGSVMTLTLAGDLMLSDGMLDLTGNIQPRPGHVSRFAKVLPMADLFKASPQKGVPIRITGTFTSPEITL